MTSARRRCTERGTLLPALAAIIIVVVMFAGLVIDVGVLQEQRGQAQIAADTAAVAGAMELLPTGNGSTWATNAANNTTTWNGFKNGVNGTTVTATPNTTTNTMTVTITKNVNTYFMHALGIATMPVTVTATAGLGPSTSCLVALDHTASRALDVGGDIALNCGTQVNSSNSNAAYWEGTAGCLTTTAANINGTGPGYYDSGGGSCTGGHYAVTPSGTSLTPSTGKPQIADPIAGSVTAPTWTPANCTGTCTKYNATTYTSNQTPPLVNGVYTVPCAGGLCLYNGGLTINGTPSQGVTFSPGTYIIYGGGLTVNSTATVSGTGVFFYETGSSASNIYPITISGSGVNANFTAPTSGTYSGMLFWVDGRLASSGNCQNQVNGNSTGTFDGTIYMPSSNLCVTGSGSKLNDSGNYSIVAGTVTVNGSATLRLQRSGGSSSSQQLAILTQ